MDKPKVLEVKDKQDVEPIVTSEELAVEEELPLSERKKADEGRVVFVEAPKEEVKEMAPSPVIEGKALRQSEPLLEAPVLSKPLERINGIVQPPAKRDIEVVPISNAPVSLSARTAPWMAKESKPFVKEVKEASESRQVQQPRIVRQEVQAPRRESFDLASLNAPQRDVIAEYRKEASRDILPPEPMKPLTIADERAKARELAGRIASEKGSESFFTKLKKKVFG